MQTLRQDRSNTRRNNKVFFRTEEPDPDPGPGPDPDPVTSPTAVLSLAEH